MSLADPDPKVVDTLHVLWEICWGTMSLAEPDPQVSDTPRVL
jgi:hypothetical protein